MEELICQGQTALLNTKSLHTARVAPLYCLSIVSLAHSSLTRLLKQIFLTLKCHRSTRGQDSQQIFCIHTSLFNSLDRFFFFFFCIPKQKQKMCVIRKNCKVLFHRLIVDIFSSSLSSRVNKPDCTDSLPLPTQWKEGREEVGRVFASQTPIIFLPNSLRPSAE